MISEVDILNCFQHLVDAKNDELVYIGSGDDAAVLKLKDNYLVHSLDISKIGTHFPEHCQPDLIAYRSVAVALSDLAAMGVYPSFLTIGLTSNEKNIQWYKKFTNGLEKIINEFNINLVGGDVTFGETNICVNVFGFTNKNVLSRCDAKVGDLIYITGSLGKARKGLKDWKNKIDSSFVENYFRPKAQIKKGIYISNYANACIDISDGLTKDLGSIVEKSKVGAYIDFNKIPITTDFHDLSYGDDYELCFTAPKKYQDKFNSNEYFLIGEITKGNSLEILKDDKLITLNTEGWDSFNL